ncbi:MAG: methyltransferase domain-containing protein [Acidobacteria bacterium]|nr:methyltransferase domain-containing protein [Acidobacteriota bacterium]
MRTEAVRPDGSPAAARDADLIDRVIQSYRPDGPFMVLRAKELQAIYTQYRLDPRMPVPAVFAVESLAHFLQDGITALFRALNLTSDSLVLSVGEGNGAPSRLLAKLVGCRIVGVDVSPLQIANAREVARVHGVGHLVEYVQQNASALDLGAQRFDAAYFNETMCHWEDKLTALRRTRAHLKPKALLGINDWLRGRRGTLNDAYEAVPAFRGLYQPDVWRQISLGETCRLLEEAGFQVLRAEERTDLVDRGLKRRLGELQRLPQNDEPVRRGVRYYEGMLAAHYDYVCYGRVIARAA